MIEGWYDNDAFVEINPSTDLPRTVKMIGVGEYNLQTSPRSAVALKLATGGIPMYVGFNSAAGANLQNDEADNEVTIATKDGDYYDVSYLRAHLVQGEEYDYNNQGIIVSAECISTANTPLVACVCIREAGMTCPDCECDDSPPPPTPPPTPWSGTGPESSFRVEVTIDNYPTETTWNLVNVCTGVEVQAGGEDYDTANGVYVDEFVVDTARYTFTINDSYGDGICCVSGQGSYTVTLDGTVEIMSGGAYGFGESKTFGSCDDGPPPTPPPTNPSPTTPPPTTPPPTTPPPTTPPPTTPPPTTPPPTTPPPTPPPINSPTNPPMSEGVIRIDFYY